ncbi:MAG TPA: hypothetical protein VKC17_05120 [Sphingomicrobium sp.]|nr:hypothetical protein [Sphingomicrobium sp.]
MGAATVRKNPGLSRAAAGPTDTAGPKLGETGVSNSLQIGENKELALLSPVSIVAGSDYALGLKTPFQVFMSSFWNEAGDLYLGDFEKALHRFL